MKKKKKENCRFAHKKSTLKFSLTLLNSRWIKTVNTYVCRSCNTRSIADKFAFRSSRSLAHLLADLFVQHIKNWQSECHSMQPADTLDSISQFIGSHSHCELNSRARTQTVICFLWGAKPTEAINICVQLVEFIRTGVLFVCVEYAQWTN